MSYDEIVNELMPELADSILENCTVKFSASGVLTVDGDKLTLKEISGWMLNFCRAPEHKKFIPLLVEAPNPSHFLEMFKTHLKIGRSKHRNSVYKGADDVVKGFSYDGMIPFISITNEKKILFFSKKKKEITDLAWGTYASSVDKEYRINPMPAVIEFNPYRPEQIYMGTYNDEQECTHLNTYRKPDWQLARKLSDKEATDYSKLPKIIDDFFSHLFPNARCKEFTYDWFHYALSSRNETYLVMNGAKGLGKNILSNMIGSSLVGANNHKIAHKGALDRFNVILTECRMIVFDEFKIVDDEAINTLKRFANADQMIERKTIDTNKTEKTYNSYIICNNAVTDMRIEWDDRRFSVLDLSDKKLNDAWSKEKIDELVAICENPNSKEMIAFGYWLLYRKPVVMVNEFTMYQGDHFYKLCYTSFPEWAKMLIDEITTNPRPYYEESDLRMMIKERTNGQQRLPAKARIEDFLKNYKHLGENYLGTIERDERTYYLQVDETFIKSSKDETGINFESTDLL
jgi:hypothetical protein